MRLVSPLIFLLLTLPLMLAVNTAIFKRYTKAGKGSIFITAPPDLSVLIQQQMKYSLTLQDAPAGSTSEGRTVPAARAS